MPDRKKTTGPSRPPSGGRAAPFPTAARSGRTGERPDRPAASFTDDGWDDSYTTVYRSGEDVPDVRADPARNGSGGRADNGKSGSGRPGGARDPRVVPLRSAGRVRFRLIGRRKNSAADATRETHVRRKSRLPLILTLSGLFVLIIVIALIWGSALKRESDALRAAEASGAWTLPDDQPTPIRVSVPEVRAEAVAPGGSIEAARTAVVPRGIRRGALLTLSPDAEGLLPYALPLAVAEGMTVADGAPTLSEDCRRMASAGLYTIGVYAVTCFDPSVTSDAARCALVRGRELALLTSAASEGVDQLLLSGLPCGTDEADAASAAFLRELKASMAASGHAPAVGVVLTPEAFTVRRQEEQTAAAADGEEGADDVPTIAEQKGTVYAGSLTPGRLLLACDCLVLDLRGRDPSGADAWLKDFTYACTRFTLSLMIGSSLSDAASAHGFERLLIVD